MNQVYLYVWLSAMTFIIVIAPLSRKARGRKIPTSQEFFVAAYTLGGVITMVRVFLKVVTQEQLQIGLEWDGVIAICASSAWIAFLALKEISKLF